MLFGVTAQSAHSENEFNADLYSWQCMGDGNIYNNGSGVDATGGYSLSGDTIEQCALDLDNNRVAFGQDNAWQTGSGGWSGSYSDYETITAAASTAAGFYFFNAGDMSGSRAYTCDYNFGGCPAFAISSAAADANGYGTFEFAPPSGFLALCSKNIGDS